MDWVGAVKGVLVAPAVAPTVAPAVAPAVEETAATTVGATVGTTVGATVEETEETQLVHYPAVPYNKVGVDIHVPAIELETSTPEVVEFAEAWVFNNPGLLQSVGKVSDLHKSWRDFLAVYLSHMEGFDQYMAWVTTNNKLMGAYPDVTFSAMTELEKKVRLMSFQNCLWALSVGSKSLTCNIGGEWKTGFLQIIKFKKYGDMAYVKWIITDEALVDYKRGARWEKNDYYDYCA